MNETGYIYRIGNKLFVRYGRTLNVHKKYPMVHFSSEKECMKLLDKLIKAGYKRGDALSDTSLWQEDSLWEGDYNFIN